MRWRRRTTGRGGSGEEERKQREEGGIEGKGNGPFYVCVRMMRPCVRIPPPEVGGHRLTLQRSVGRSVSTPASCPVQHSIIYRVSLQSRSNGSTNRTEDTLRFNRHSNSGSRKKCSRDAFVSGKHEIPYCVFRCPRDFATDRRPGKH